MFNFSAVVRRVAKHVISLTHGYLRKNVNVRVDRIKPLVGDVLVRTPQHTRAFGVGRVQLYCPVLRVGEDKVSTQIAQFKGDGFPFRPVFVGGALLGGGVLTGPTHLRQGRVLTEVGSNLAEVLDWNRERNSQQQLNNKTLYTIYMGDQKAGEE